MTGTATLGCHEERTRDVSSRVPVPPVTASRPGLPVLLALSATATAIARVGGPTSAAFLLKAGDFPYAYGTAVVVYLIAALCVIRRPLEAAVPITRSDTQEGNVSRRPDG